MYEKVNNHVLDKTTPWYEFLYYTELCKSLGRESRITSFLRFMKYVKFICDDA